MEKGKLIINGVDVSGSVGSAASVPYSNTNSGLEATNTQGAIDELATSVSELNSNLGGFTPIIDDTGKITGYKTNVGGADTVFPFKSAPSSVIVATLIGGRYANGSSNSSHASTTDDTVFTVKDVTDSLSGGRLTALKACSGKLFVVGAQRGGSASATVKLNGTTIVSGSAYTNGYKAEISLVPNDYITISLSKPDTTYAAFGCVLVVTLD